MQWSDHIAHAIKRSMKALNAIRLIINFFNAERATLPCYFKLLLNFVL